LKGEKKKLERRAHTLRHFLFSFVAQKKKMFPLFAKLIKLNKTTLICSFSCYFCFFFCSGFVIEADNADRVTKKALGLTKKKNLLHISLHTFLVDVSQIAPLLIFVFFSKQIVRGNFFYFIFSG